MVRMYCRSTMITFGSIWSMVPGAPWALVIGFSLNQRIFACLASESIESGSAEVQGRGIPERSEDMLRKAGTSGMERTTMTGRTNDDRSSRAAAPGHEGPTEGVWLLAR